MHTNIFTVLIVGFFAAILSSCSLFEGLGEKSVRYVLKDGNSAEFRNVRRGHPDKSKPESAEFFCGEVNSKNGRGAFTGFEKFVVADRMVMLESGETAVYKGGLNASDPNVRSYLYVTELELNTLRTRAETEALERELRIKKDKNLYAEWELLGKPRIVVTPLELAWERHCE